MATATAKPAAREKRVKGITPKAETPAPAKKAAPKPARRERRITPAEAHAKVAAKKAVPKKAPAEKKVAANAPKTSEGGSLGNLVDTIDFLDEMGPSVAEMLVTMFVKPNWGTKLMDAAHAECIVVNKRFASRIKGTDTAMDGKTFLLNPTDIALKQERKDGGCVVISLSENARPVALTFDARSRKRLSYTEVPKDEDKFDEYLRALVETANKMGANITIAD